MPRSTQFLSNYKVISCVSINEVKAKTTCFIANGLANKRIDVVEKAIAAGTNAYSI
jgi:hypothetical protein